MLKVKTKGFRPMIRSRHPSHSILRGDIGIKLPFRSVVRLGSTTSLPDDVTNGGRRVECNTVQAVKNSANKRLMKDRFTAAGVKTADWFIHDNGNWFNFSITSGDNRVNVIDLPYPIIAKQIYGSRGNGNYKLNNPEELQAWITGKTLSNYIFEKFYNYSREYRLHITEDGCFYTCRKMLKSDTPEDQRWFRNDKNSNWWVESNEGFDKPVNWNDVVAESVKALKAVGLDVGAVDLRIQSRLDSKDRVRENPEFIVIEINSAPSFGSITGQKYIEQIPKILIKKHDATKL